MPQYIGCTGYLHIFSPFTSDQMSHSAKQYILSILTCLCVSSLTFAQVDQDSATVSVVSNQPDSLAASTDTLKAPEDDLAPLDIGNDRGIFILSNDRLLQLRILGSIRVGLNYTDEDLNDNQTFNPYEIPTEDNLRTPQFFIGIEQTRLGLEVIRRTNRGKDIFIRFEGDFKNEGKALRIRHAYARYGNFLVGQTWSLINNVEFQPSLVSLDGPAGGSGLRTPQVRFNQSLSEKWRFSTAIEYSLTEYQVPDSVDLITEQSFPNATVRFLYNSERFSMRLTGLLATISGRFGENRLKTLVGYGVSLAMRLNLLNGRLYNGLSYGRAASHYFDMLNGKDEDVFFDPDRVTLRPLYSYLGYIAYEHDILKNFTASVSYGIGAIENIEGQSNSAYNFSWNTLINWFWSPVSGTQIGLEYAFGKRHDILGSSLIANRVSALLYYDF